MLLGARQFFERRGAGGWTNPYVTDGLVAMWDGEWNAGPGVHDSTINYWYDLTGNNHVMYAPTPSWGDNYALCANTVDSRFRETAAEAAWFKDLISTGRFTVEVVFQPSGGGGAIALNYYVEGFGLLIKSVATTVSRSGVDFNLATNVLGGTAINTEKRIQVDGLNYLDARCAQVSCDTSTGIFSCNGTEWAITGTFDVTMDSAGMALGSRGNLQSWDASGNTGTKHFRVAMYNRTLTAAELSANYAIDRARFNLP